MTPLPRSPAVWLLAALLMLAAVFGFAAVLLGAAEGLAALIEAARGAEAEWRARQ